MASVGMHCILELYGCPEKLLDDVAFVQSALRKAAESAGATWLGEVAHAFKPSGVAVVGLLAESHISIHTWPERGYGAVDVFTCGDEGTAEAACRNVIDVMGATRHTLTRFARPRTTGWSSGTPVVQTIGADTS